jgi:hypothetical protein
MMEATNTAKDKLNLSAAKSAPEQGEQAAMEVNDDARNSPGAATKEKSEM